MRRDSRSTAFGVVWALALGGAILAHRAGLMPAWVYHGRLRDEVKRRTGVDLADRSAPTPILDVRTVGGSGGRYPTLTVAVRNATDSTLRHVDLWARFHLATRDAGMSEIVRVVRDDAPLAPGASRTVTLRAQTAQGLGVTTRGPLLTADLYWTFITVAPHRIGRQSPRLSMIRVE